MKMRFFTFELIKAANDWIRQSRKEHEIAEKTFWKTAEKYRRSLEKLKPRLSKKAWEFFYYGYASTGLHDATLLKFVVGDSLSYTVDGKDPLRLNKRKTSAIIELLNYEQDLHYTFDLREVSGARCDISSGLWDVGDLYTYEIIGIGVDKLQIGFVFASGSTIILQFRKLVLQNVKSIELIRWTKFICKDFC